MGLIARLVHVQARTAGIAGFFRAARELLLPRRLFSGDHRAVRAPSGVLAFARLTRQAHRAGSDGQLWAAA
jgi:hypothetical protein